MFKSTYEAITKGNPMWNQLSVPTSKLYSWDSSSTYIHEPPYFKNMTMDPPGPHGVKDAYCLLNFGDSITTDHISPAGSIHKDSPAAKFLLERGVDRRDFNSYGSRRGNDEIMARGTFANIRIVNKLLNGEVGPKTVHIPTGEKLYVFDAAMVIPLLFCFFLPADCALFSFTGECYDMEFVSFDLALKLTRTWLPIFLSRDTRQLVRTLLFWQGQSMEVEALVTGLPKGQCYW